MSGGHFNYACHRIDDLAEDLQREIEINDSEETDRFGEYIGRHFEPETMEVIVGYQKMISICGKAAREIEWLYSGDHSEESFMKKIKEIVRDSQ